MYMYYYIINYIILYVLYRSRMICIIWDIFEFLLQKQNCSNNYSCYDDAGGGVSLQVHVGQSQRSPATFSSLEDCGLAFIGRGHVFFCHGNVSAVNVPLSKWTCLLMSGLNHIWANLNPGASWVERNHTDQKGDHFISEQSMKMYKERKIQIGWRQ